MQFVGNVFSSVHNFYKGINPATLSGAIDILVIEQPNGELRCSPFHVRFGKAALLLPTEKTVEIFLNGEPLDLHMKVGEAGEAFFVVESDNPVSNEYATSPIPARSGSPLPNVEFLSLDSVAASSSASNLSPSSSSSSSSTAASSTLKDDTGDQSLPSDSNVNTINPSANSELPQVNARADLVESDSSFQTPMDMEFKNVPMVHPATPSDLLKPAPAPASLSPSPLLLPAKATATAQDDEDAEAFSKLEANAAGSPLASTSPYQNTESTKISPHSSATENDNDMAAATVISVTNENAQQPVQSPFVAGDERSASDTGEAEAAVDEDKVEQRQPSGQLLVAAESSSLSSSPLPFQMPSAANVNATDSDAAATSELDSQTHPGGVKHIFAQTRENESFEEVSQPPIHETAAHHETLIAEEVNQNKSHLTIDESLPAEREEDESAETKSSEPNVKFTKQASEFFSPPASRPHRLQNEDNFKSAMNINEEYVDSMDSHSPYGDNQDPKLEEYSEASPDNFRKTSASTIFTMDEEKQGPLSDTELDAVQNKSSQKTSQVSPPIGPSSDGESEYAAPASRSLWSWGWGSLPVKGNAKSPVGSAESLLDPDAAQAASKDLFEHFSNKQFGTGWEISLCGEKWTGPYAVVDTDANNAAIFKSKQITVDNATSYLHLLTQKNCVYKLNGRHYPGDTIAPLLLHRLVYGRSLPQEQIKNSLKAIATNNNSTNNTSVPPIVDAKPATPAPSSPSAQPLTIKTEEVRKSTLRSWLMYGNKPAVGEDASKSLSTSPPTSILSSSPPTAAPSGAAPPAAAPEKQQKTHYMKSLRLTSDQLKKLNLRHGVNHIAFKVRARLQGETVTRSKLFLWRWDERLVISDVDGTITKSDVMGHILTLAGRDWTHVGIAALYTLIAKNGYKFLYLTSRGLGQADYTRYYLEGVQQDGHQLPDGPCIMSPDRLFTAFHREVIQRKPEEFKIACLKDIHRLFPSEPFYAGFGNRETDAKSYKAVNVPTSRIFTVNPQGEVKLEILEGYKSSYVKLTDLVDQMFPPIRDRSKEIKEEFSDFNYWKSPLPPISIPLTPSSSSGGGLARAGSNASNAKSVVDSKKAATAQSGKSPLSVGNVNDGGEAGRPSGAVDTDSDKEGDTDEEMETGAYPYI